MGQVTEQRLLKKGAEASLFEADWHGKHVVVKTRLPKRYRPAKLDKAIRTSRTIHEPQLMGEAKKAGVPTPTIYQVDLKNSIIVMELIEGKQVKEVLNSSSASKREHFCIKIGELIGKLHLHGVIHGDLTTSNMILGPDNEIFLIDFGLGEKNTELEAKGVDLHLLKRALQSTHFQFAEECFASVVKGYSDIFGKDEAKDVLGKVREIERRGRYVPGRKGSTDIEA